MDWLKRIKALEESEAQTKQQAAAETTLDLWRWFALEADRVYRSAPKAADTWELHKEHKRAADDLCRAGNISAARAELEKALTALQGAAVSQTDLLAA